MENYTLIKIYILSQQKLTQRELKKILKEKYDIDISLDNLRIILKKIKRPTKKNVFTKFELNKILYMYKNCKDINILCYYLNNKYSYSLTYSKIVKIAYDNNVIKKNKKISSFKKILKKEEIEIIEKYKSGKTSYELAKDYNYKTHKSITDILIKNGIEIRNSAEIQRNKRNYKGLSFKYLDSKVKAYYIGLLLTDGYVSKNKVGIDLIDEDTICFLSKEFNVNYIKLKKKEQNRQDMYRLTIYGNEYLEDLYRFGIFKRKTFTTKGCVLNKTEEIFIPYIIRGIIDGDGWIRRDGKEFFISSASKDFIIWCKKSLEQFNFINLKIVFIKNNYKGIYLIRSANSTNIQLLKDIIYKEELGMERKRKRLFQ